MSISNPVAHFFLLSFKLLGRLSIELWIGKILFMIKERLDRRDSDIRLKDELKGLSGSIFLSPHHSGNTCIHGY